MDAKYITGEAVRELEQKYPAAYHMLLRHTLEQERIELERELTYQYVSDMRRNWIVARLADMQSLGC